MKLPLPLALILFLSATFLSQAVGYTSSAESTGWNGAHSSTSSGFEAMFYNPAGIFFSEAKFGINILGSVGMRAYTNAFSTSDVIQTFKTLKSDNRNITAALHKQLGQIPETGLSFGFDFSHTFFMAFRKYQTFAFAASWNTRSYCNFTLGKDLFHSLFQKLSLEKGINERVRGTFLLYEDLNFSLSTRASFLEKLLPAINGIYVGFSTHVYVPLLYSNFDTSVRIKTGSTDPITGIYRYDTQLSGEFTYASILPGNLFRNLPLPDAGNFNYQSILNNSGSFGVGFGLDLGILLEINRFIRVGLSVTDLGFFVFDKTIYSSFYSNRELDVFNPQDFLDHSLNAALKEFSNNFRQRNTPLCFMPATAIRTGAAITPLKNRIIQITLPINFSVSHFQEIAEGGIPVLDVATGIEVIPSTGWFSVPLRISIGYSTRSNMAVLACGAGLYLGPCVLEFGLQGIEALIFSFGARSFSIALDLKFLF